MSLITNVTVFLLKKIFIRNFNFVQPRSFFVSGRLGSKILKDKDDIYTWLNPSETRNSVRHQKLLTLNLSSKRLHKLQLKISGHTVLLIMLMYVYNKIKKTVITIISDLL